MPFEELSTSVKIVHQYMQKLLMHQSWKSTLEVKYSYLHPKPSSNTDRCVFLESIIPRLILLYFVSGMLFLAESSKCVVSRSC